MSTPTLIGRYAVIPVSVPHDRSVHDLRLDLTDVYCLRFEAAGMSFAVSREGLQTLLDAYDDMQARVNEQLYESSCTGPSTGLSPQSPSSDTNSSTRS